MYSIFRSVTDVDFMPSLELHTINMISYWFLLQRYQYLDYTVSNGSMTDKLERIRRNQDATSQHFLGGTNEHHKKPLGPG
jgi:hypothetical protein